jgi:NAD+ kinase
MQRFIIITNAYKDKDLFLTHKLISYIEEKGGTASYFLSNIRRVPEEDFAVSEIPSDTDCILVLGGDGTLIRAATKVESLQIPLIGVNLGTLGYLCELEESTVFSAIDRMMAQDYELEERMMLTGWQEPRKEAKVALNDIVFHRTGALSILSFHVYVNGEFLNTYRADGIIIATPTGSTGYSMSAGGPIVDPTAKVILLTPVNAHNLNSKSIVLSAEDEIVIEIGTRRAERDEQVAVSFDGDEAACLCVGDRFVVAQASRVTKICKLSRKSFLQTLRKKMETYS